MWPVLPVEADCPPLQLEAAAGAHQAAVVEGEARAQAQRVVRPHLSPAPSTAAASGHLLGPCVVIGYTLRSIKSAKLPALITYLEMLFTIVFVIDNVDLAGDDGVAHAAAVPDLLHSEEDGGSVETASTFSLIDESTFLQFHP